jgi:general secretion pathway protein I
VNRRGFTLLEVMISLAILAFGLGALMKSATNNIASAERSHMMGVVTNLARGKMLDIEEKLAKDGFTDTDQSEDNKDFADEGWPDIKYSYKIEQVELPSFEDLQAMVQQRMRAGSGSAGLASGSGSGSGSGSRIDASGFMDSALGGLLMSAGGDVASAQGGAFIQTFYPIIHEVLKVSIRKISLTVNYKVLGRDEDPLVVVLYLTDASAIDKVLMGFGSQDLPDDSGSGSGSNSRGSNTGSGSNTIQPPGRGSNGVGK